MLLFNVSKNEKGFTLVEIAATTIIAGVLAAIAAPSLAGMYNRSKINDALNQLRSNLQEAQRVAIKSSSSCVVNLPSNNTNNITITSTCIKSSLSFDGKLKEVVIRHNYTTPLNKITFNYKGNINDLGTIVLSIPNSKQQKCLITSTGIGLVRSGDYALSDTTGATASNCTTKQQ